MFGEDDIVVLLLMRLEDRSYGQSDRLLGLDSVVIEDSVDGRHKTFKADALMLLVKLNLGKLRGQFYFRIQHEGIKRSSHTVAKMKYIHFGFLLSKDMQVVEEPARKRNRVVASVGNYKHAPVSPFVIQP